MKQYENSRHLDRVVVRDFAIARYWETEADKHMAFVPILRTRPCLYFDPLGNGIAVYESIRLNDPPGRWPTMPHLPRPTLTSSIAATRTPTTTMN